MSPGSNFYIRGWKASGQVGKAVEGEEEVSSNDNPVRKESE